MCCRLLKMLKSVAAECYRVVDNLIMLFKTVAMCCRPMKSVAVPHKKQRKRFRVLQPISWMLCNTLRYSLKLCNNMQHLLDSDIHTKIPTSILKVFTDNSNETIYLTFRNQKCVTSINSILFITVLA